MSGKEFLQKISTGDIRNILAVMSVVGMFVVIILLILKPVPEVNQAAVNIALGTLLGGLVGGVAGYYFGASKDQKKDE